MPRRELPQDSFLKEHAKRLFRTLMEKTWEVIQAGQERGLQAQVLPLSPWFLICGSLFACLCFLFGWLVFHFLFFVGFFVFSGPQPMEVPRLGVQSELQLPAYTAATATPDPSHICDLQHSARQCWILNPLSETRDRTHILKDTMSGS